MYTESRLDKSIDNWGFFYRAPYEEFRSEYLNLEKVGDFNELPAEKKQELFLAISLFAILREKHHLQRDAYSYDEFVEFSKKCHKIYSVSSLRSPSSDEVLKLLLDGVDGVFIEGARKVVLKNPEFVIRVIEGVMKDFSLGDLALKEINQSIGDGFKKEVALFAANKMTVFDGEGDPLVKDLSSFEGLVV